MIIKCPGQTKPLSNEEWLDGFKVRMSGA